jgi:UDP-2-acetamido-2,6-beta-L-arabino-hexul-4-ose reductase
VALLRLTNVFGKWARPFYNSAVATFCHQVANGLPLTIHDPTSPLRLVYVDDVIDAFMALLRSPPLGVVQMQVGPEYASSVGEVAATLEGFAQSRTSLISPPVGTGLTRALYATYLSHLPPQQFAYALPRHGDARGEFVEMLKTPDCGQFSYFTAHPGVTRGGHYHHTKSEKFLVLQGTARFGFRQLDTGATAEIVTRGGEAKVVETIPGWTHDITNIGDDDLIVMLWANEIFDRARPDTVAMKVVP